mmetsp:Transcript_43089/g.66214  ORF Transcript_43089/g.66214 Transcript_43089/m.66214 type:complete len:90 (+) Transcript_43089:273-542(+)
MDGMDAGLFQRFDAGPVQQGSAVDAKEVHDKAFYANLLSYLQSGGVGRGSEEIGRVGHDGEDMERGLKLHYFGKLLLVDYVEQRFVVDD